jgi:ribulose-phosphate 3-epimerase
MSRPIKIAPSVLPADFARLGDEVAALEAAGVDLIQWDVMDGQFVPNLTFGPDVIKSARPHCSVPFEAHLMVYTPDVMAEQYVDAGCSRLIVHAEACTHLHRTLGNINSMGARGAVALNPATPASAIEHVLDLVDLVLVMTVNPGFGGQAYIPTMEPKIAELRRMIEVAGLSDAVDLHVHGVGASCLVDHPAYLGDLWFHRGDVRLATEPGVHRHHQDEVDEVEHVGHGRRRGSRIVRHRSRRAELGDVAERAVQVGARLGVDDQS